MIPSGGVLTREQLVPSRVEDAEGGGKAFQQLEDADEVALLAGQGI